MATSSGLMARALLVSGCALGLAVWFAQDSLDNSEAVKETVAKHIGFPMLCFDPTTVHALRWGEPQGEQNIARSDRWRDAKGLPVEDARVMVLLNQLRQTRSKLPAGMNEPAADLDADAMGLTEPSQWLEAVAGTSRCRIELGLRHPEQDLWSVRVTGDGGSQIGWASPPLDEGVLLRRHSLRAQRIVPHPPGEIDHIELNPALGDGFELQRQRGGFQLVSGSHEGPADEEAMEGFFEALVGLRGELLPEPIPMDDADLRIALRRADQTSELAFFVQFDGVVVRAGTDSWALSTGIDQRLKAAAASYRDRRVLRYDRGAVASITTVDENGLSRTYKREVRPGSVDRWTMDGVPIEQGHRLAALQWELHTLRAERYVDDIAAIECGACRRLTVIDRSGSTTVELLIKRSEGGWLVRNGSGPVLRVSEAVIAGWPFEKLN